MRPSAARDLLKCGTRKADARLDPDFNAAQHSPMECKVCTALLRGGLPGGKEAAKLELGDPREENARHQVARQFV